MQNLNKGDCLHTTDKPHKRYKRTVLKKEKKKREKNKNNTKLEHVQHGFILQR